MTDLATIAGRIAAQRKYVKRNYVAAASVSLNYARYRVLRPILKAYNQLLVGKSDSVPWMSPAAIAIFDSILTAQMHGFEFGSGRSTRFFARKIKSLVSLEHDDKWFHHVSEQLGSQSIGNVDYHLIEPDSTDKPILIRKRWDDFTVGPVAATCYERYHSFINRFPDESFDFIVVDGRARTECAVASIPKLKSGGFLVLDNSERLRYQPIHRTLSNWKKVYTTTGLTDTIFWFKP